MKQSGWIKRTPLKRGKPLKRSAIRASASLDDPGRKRTPLRKRSAKRQKLYEEVRIPLVEKLLSERPYCEACELWAAHDRLTEYVLCRSVDIHEVLPRGRGGSIVDEDNCIAICRRCHDRVMEDIDGATDLGLLKKATK